MKCIKQTVMLCVLLFTAVALYACGGDDDNGGSKGNTTPLNVPTRQHTYAASGGAWDFSVQAGQKPTVAASASWLAVSEQPSTSATVFKYTATADATTDTDDRTATITISAGGQTETIAVTQTARDGLVVVSDKSVSVAAAGGTVAVTLRANADYAVQTSAEWVSSVATRGNMQEYHPTFAVTDNIGAARTATISFTLGELTESVTISQEAGQQGPVSLDARQTAKLMYPGWNLGNTMEASGSGIGAETSWQGTKTTQQIIDFVKAQGFRSVRIPCSWDIHTDADGRIDAAWMSRVQEIVDYCIRDGLYVLLNDHWDNGWIEVLGFSKTTDKYEIVDEATITAKAARLRSLWTQIATHFIGYDEHLLFAGLNEPFQQWNLFNGHHRELTPILQRYNQAFVEAVRATGGNNALRTLVVQAPSTSISSATDEAIGFTMPTDPAGTGHLMVEVHYYEPWDFCGQEDDGKWFWGAANHVSGDSHNSTWGEQEWTKSQMAAMRSKFVDRGYPVIIGECGANWRKLAAHQTEHDASVKAWFKCLNTEAANNGCVTMMWDINSPSQNGEKGTLTVVNRAELTVFCTPALEGTREGVAEATWPD